MTANFCFRDAVGAGIAMAVLAGFVIGAAMIVVTRDANGREAGQWEAMDEDVRAWFRELKQPDNPHMSCCGLADAYYADKVVTRNGRDYAIITDTRDDAPLQRPHVPVGTEIEIPPHKYKWDRGNPTGHNIIFLSLPGQDYLHNVYCFVDSGGV